PAEQAGTVHPRSVTIEVRQAREHLADRSVDRRARLESNCRSTYLLHALTAPDIRFDCHDWSSDPKSAYPCCKNAQASRSMPSSARETFPNWAHVGVASSWSLLRSSVGPR